MVSRTYRLVTLRRDGHPTSSYAPAVTGNLSSAVAEACRRAIQSVARVAVVAMRSPAVESKTAAVVVPRENAPTQRCFVALTQAERARAERALGPGERFWSPSETDVRQLRAARLQLGSRRARCQEQTFREVQQRLDQLQTSQPWWPEEARLSAGEVMRLLRLAADPKSRVPDKLKYRGYWRSEKAGYMRLNGRAVESLPGQMREETAVAVRRRDGAVAWAICRTTADGRVPCLPVGMSPQPADRRTAQQWARSRNVSVVGRCPCTAEDLVTLDSLLALGDKQAERLAKACRRGGAVLEGARKRKQAHGA